MTTLKVPSTGRLFGLKRSSRECAIAHAACMIGDAGDELFGVGVSECLRDFLGDAAEHRDHVEQGVPVRFRGGVGEGLLEF